MNAIGVLIFSIITLIIMLSIRLPLFVILLIVPFLSSILYGGLGFTHEVLVKTLISHSTWGLVLNVFCVSWLVSLYSSSSIVHRLGKELSKALKSDFLTLTIVPGVIGLLPVAGGALLSAPIVDSIGEHTGLSKLKRNIVNIWYRHIFVYVYPLSPVIILTCSLFNIGIGRLILDQLLLAFLMFVIGIPLIGLKWKVSASSSNNKILVKDLSPILVAVIMSFVLSPIDKYIPIDRMSMTLAVLLGIILFISIEKIPLNIIMRSIKDKRIWELSVISLEVMLYRTLFTSMDLQPIVTIINGSNISQNLIIIALTAFFSFISGTPTAGVAIAAPIIQNLVGLSRAVADLVYSASFIGYLGSPLHLCYVYSSRHFETGIIEGYKYLVPLTVFSLGLVLLMYYFVWI